jgi:hypothetical protein
VRRRSRIATVVASRHPSLTSSSPSIPPPETRTSFTIATSSTSCSIRWRDGFWGATPDLDRRFAAERLGEELRRRAVTLTHRAYLVNQDLEDGSVSPENVGRLCEAGESVSKALDEIEDEFG